MSTFEPMSEAALHEIAGNCATETSVLSRVVATALHHLASAKAAEEALDLAIAERDQAYRQRDAQASRVLGMGSMLDDARTILGATDGETLSEAARRVVAAAHEAQVNANQYRAWVNAAALAMGETYHSNVPARVAALMRETVDLRARLDADAEAEPAQTFPIQHAVTIRNYGSGKAGAEISINGVITDPAFLALSGNDYARLALVVTRG
jgi:hypothetical protein